MEKCGLLVKLRSIDPNLVKGSRMAKSKLKISADVPPCMILVKSRACGDHLRAKRGAYKKAKLNASLKEGEIARENFNHINFYLSISATCQPRISKLDEAFRNPPENTRPWVYRIKTLIQNAIIKMHT